MAAKFPPGLIFVCVIAAILSPAVSLGEVSERAGIRVEFSPGLKEVRPLDRLVELSIAVAGVAEGPVDLSLALWAPPRDGVVSTDFPLVEGTQLLQMDVRLPDGKLNLAYAFPIRGSYRLELAAVDAGGQALQRTVLIEIAEHWLRWGFLGVFLAAIFALGFLAGRLFSARPVTVGLLIAVCPIALIALLIAVSSPEAASTASAGRLSVSPARVGALSTIQWTAADTDVQPLRPVILSMRIVQLEKQRPVFQLHPLATQGRFAFGFQFTDASAHLVEATSAVEPGQDFEQQVAETIQVTSPEPPLRDRLVPVLISLLILAAGLATGRVSRRRARRK